MNEAETRAEQIDTALAAADWGFCSTNCWKSHLTLTPRIDQTRLS